MALSVLQFNVHKSSIYNKTSISSVTQYKFFNEATNLLGVALNKNRNSCQKRSFHYLAPNTPNTKHTNFPQKLHNHNVWRYGIFPAFGRTYSTNEENRSFNKPQLPTLMAFPQLVWPSFLKTIKNWILVNFIIRPYFDQEFTMPSFVIGAKQALQVVSSSLASGQLQSLDGLVSADALDELNRNISVMSVGQRNEIAVDKNDIYFSFPYQVGVIFDESNEKVQKRFVEITMVFHVLRGLKEMQDQGITPPLNVGTLPEYRDKISICNYRFIKQFTQGIESDWTINIANHFKPVDLLDE